MTTVTIDLVRDVLDHVVVDRDGVPCGMVDDIALDSDARDRLVPAALLIGPGAWTRRLPRWLGAPARRAFGARVARVDWSEVTRVGERVELRSMARDLSLDGAERRWSRWIGRIPGAGR